jgi:hypothetical protein
MLSKPWYFGRCGIYCGDDEGRQRRPNNNNSASDKCLAIVSGVHARAEEEDCP